MLVRHLRIERFRSLSSFEWRPSPGLNCLIGPIDSGKTTVLAALELLLCPRGSLVSEYDYRNRDLQAGFEITAVLTGLSDEFLAGLRVPLLHGWTADGLRPLPDEDGAEQAVLVRVRGTPDLEAEHSMVGPSGEESPFGLGLRRKLLAARLSAQGVPAELRLGKGTLLGKHVEADLRSSVVAALAATSRTLALPVEVGERVGDLRDLFGRAGLPQDIHLGFVSPRSESLQNFVGLLRGPTIDEAVPIWASGSGTQQLAVFTLATAGLAVTPVLLLDQPEAGLAPYQQRHLARRLREVTADSGQAFVTTHSPSVLSTLSGREVMRMQSQGVPVTIDQQGRLDKLLQEHPEFFLSRVPILTEGDTEAGLHDVIGNRFAREHLGSDLDALGIYLAPRRGQPHVLEEAAALAQTGLKHGLFVDKENEHVGRRATLERTPACVLGTWQEVRNVEEAVARWTPLQQLDRVLEAAVIASTRPKRMEDFNQQVAERCGRPGKHTLSDLLAEVAEDSVRAALSAAMQDRGWFKSREGGRVLGTALLDVGMPAEIGSVLERFWTAIHAAFLA
jgi:energy-coupling factor transporter ATP-binding protein EcfA2